MNTDDNQKIGGNISLNSDDFSLNDFDIINNKIDLNENNFSTENIISDNIINELHLTSNNDNESFINFVSKIDLTNSSFKTKSFEEFSEIFS